MMYTIACPQCRQPAWASRFQNVAYCTACERYYIRNTDTGEWLPQRLGRPVERRERTERGGTA